MKRGHDGPEHGRILPFRNPEMIETTTARCCVVGGGPAGIRSPGVVVSVCLPDTVDPREPKECFHPSVMTGEDEEDEEDEDLIEDGAAYRISTSVKEPKGFG
jgi:hypothetical protein